MQRDIQEQIVKAVGNGQLIRAIKLLRQAENIDLRTAKQRIEELSRQMQSNEANNPYTQSQQQQNTYSQPRVHTHRPARQEQYDLEKELPTEAFLYLQKGEVKNAIRVIHEVQGLNKNTATRLVKTFYTNHPEYHSDEVDKLMRSKLARTGGVQSKKKSNFISNIIFFIILIILINNFIN